MIFLIIILIFSLFTVQNTLAMPQIQLISQIDPVEYNDPQTIALNITSTTTNSSITQALVEIDGENHALQKKQGTYIGAYIYSWTPAQKGANTYTIHATDSLNETQSSTKTFQVQDTTPPEIIEAQPNGLLNYNLIEIEATTSENCTCKYDLTDVSYDSMYYGLSGDGTSHTKLRNFGDGTTIIYIRCKDPESNIGESQSISFTIDTTPPIISDITPTGTVAEEKISLQFYTNEPADCKWDTENKAYEQLSNNFETTGNILHEQKLTLEQGINRYYISCKDAIGSFNTPIIVNLELNLPPTASIDIEQNNSYNALNQGTYGLSLEASEPLSQAPELKLKFGDRAISIPLEGSSTEWSGYLMIPGDAGEEIGEFQYQGTDTKGKAGTEITNGKLVIIDTTPPSYIPALKLANENNKIKLSWAYEGEEADHFNIYRSTAGNTDKTDLETTASGSSYLDTGIVNKIGYFYRVSAVDKAGNEGPLSEEQFLMADFQNTTGFVQDPTIISTVNNKINGLERKVQDIELKITKFEETTDPDLLWLINQEAIVTKLKETKSKMQLLIGELKTYKETKMTLEELNKKIEVIDAKASEYDKEIIRDISIANKIEREQPYSESLLRQAIDAYAPVKSFNEAQKEAYLQKTKELQEQTRRIQQITAYELEYSDGEKKKIIVIKERLISPKDLRGVVLQEIMPADVIKLSEIEFISEPEDINALGALWSINKLESAELTYKTSSDKELNQLQQIKTALLYDADTFLSMMEKDQNTSSGEASGDQITGQAIQGSSEGTNMNTILLALGIIVILALLIYYFVFLRAENEAEEGIEKHLFAEEQALLTGLKTPSNEAIMASKEPEGLNAQDTQLAEQLFGFIQKSYLALQEGDLALASQNYNLALAQYPLVRLSLKNRMKLNLHLNTLRESILKQKN